MKNSGLTPLRLAFQSDKNCLILCGQARQAAREAGHSPQSFGLSRRFAEQVLRGIFLDYTEEEVKLIIAGRMDTGAIGLLFGLPLFVIESGAELRWEE